MMKRLHTLLISATLIFAVPAMVVAAPMIEIVELFDLETQGINVSVEQNVLTVSGAAGQTLYIYNVAGVCVSTLKVDTDEKHFDLNLQKGCYIVKVGKVVRKISIR